MRPPLPPPDVPPKAKKDAQPPASEDPWRDWQPRWQDKARSPSPHDWQEKQHPTEPVILRSGTSDRTETRGRRRILDARLWDSLSPEEQDAAIEIAFAFEAITKGMGFATSNWRRIPGSRNPVGAANGFARLSGYYMDWGRACQKEGIHHSMVIDILCYGISCGALDRDRRVRRGTSRGNLVAGLALYAHLRGWRPKRQPPGT